MTQCLKRWRRLFKDTRTRCLLGQEVDNGKLKKTSAHQTAIQGLPTHTHTDTLSHTRMHFLGVVAHNKCRGGELDWLRAATKAPDEAAFDFVVCFLLLCVSRQESASMTSRRGASVTWPRARRTGPVC